MNDVEVEVVSEDGLTGEIWQFYVQSERDMRASYFARVIRPSKRHKWTVTAHWRRTSDRTAKIKTAELCLTPEIAAKAKKTYLDRLEKTLVVSIPA
jgi:hypothetical protein